jgi:hypothetical protein
VFFPACNVRIEARAGSPCSSSAGTNAEKPWIIKEIPAPSQNLRQAASSIDWRERRNGQASVQRAKKNPNERFGFNPPLEEGGGDMRRLPNCDNQWK